MFEHQSVCTRQHGRRAVTRRDNTFSLGLSRVDPKVTARVQMRCAAQVVVVVITREYSQLTPVGIVYREILHRAPLPFLTPIPQLSTLRR